MKKIIGRLHRLEIGAGVIETAKSRRDAELADILKRRIAAGRARVGLPEATVESGEDVTGVSLVEILQRGRQPAREASIEARGTPPIMKSILSGVPTGRYS